MTALLHLPMLEALRLWSDLEQALHGTNGFGGNTAELYAYRLVSFPPSYTIRPSAREETDARCGQVLFALLVLFREEHEGCEITVDGSSFGSWVARPFSHRVHVTIYPAPNGAERRTLGNRMMAMAVALDEAADRIEMVCLDASDSDVVRFRALAAEVLP